MFVRVLSIPDSVVPVFERVIAMRTCAGGRDGTSNGLVSWSAGDGLGWGIDRI